MDGITGRGFRSGNHSSNADPNGEGINAPQARCSRLRDRRSAALGNDLVDQPVGLGFFRVEEEVPLHVGLDILHALPGTLGVDPVQLLARLEDLAGMDLDVGRLPLRAAEGWWIMMREFGSDRRLPLAPAMSRNEPMLAAMPRHIVDTSA